MKNKINRTLSIESAKSTNAQALSAIKKSVQNKNVLFVATTYLDYLRIQQEISLLNEYANHVYIIVSKNKYYVLRLIYVYFKSLFFMKKIDVVFFGFAPQLVLPLLKWRFFRKKIIIDFFISLYDTLVMDRKQFSQNSFVSKILKYIDGLTLKMADLVISDTKEHAKYFMDELACDRNKIQTLYLNADSKYYYPKEITKPNPLKDKYIVLYFGSVLPLQGTDVIIKAINLCNNNQVFYILIGPFDKNKCTNKNIKFIPWLSQEKLSEHIAFSDLCLAGHFCANIAKASRTIPGKAYIYEAMNKKIILGDNHANRERYPEGYQSVQFVKMGSPDELHKVIMKNYLEHKGEY